MGRGHGPPLGHDANHFPGGVQNKEFNAFGFENHRNTPGFRGPPYSLPNHFHPQNPNKMSKKR